MHSPQTCGCTGIRSCKVCEQKQNGTSVGGYQQDSAFQSFTWCPLCSGLRKGLVDPFTPCINCIPATGFDLPSFAGVHLYSEFVNHDEEATLVASMDKLPWKPSQSGRNKQDYGPKVNFKRKKVKWEAFTGLPKSSEFLFQRMKALEILQDFNPVEQCHLEYVPERGSSINMHFDDTWIWGDRLVTLNLLSDTVLAFTHPKVACARIDVRLPRRSLIVVQGYARYDWQHGIQRDTITARRIALTLRELGPEFCGNGPHTGIGNQLLDIALSFSGCPLP